MCGIFGLVANANSRLTTETLDRSLRLLIKLSERRGREAAGLAVASNGKISIFKQAIRPSEMLWRPDFASFLNASLRRGAAESSGRLTQPVAAIGHCRLVTNGSQAIPENNQPIGVNHIVGVHNGIITNDLELLRLNSGISRQAGSDSEVLFSLINEHYVEEHNFLKAISKTFLEITGSASVALLNSDMPLLALATNTGSLYYRHDRKRGLFVFASERHIVENFLGKTVLLEGKEPQAIVGVDPLSGVFVSFDEMETKRVSLKTVESEVSNNVPIVKKRLYSIIDHSTALKSLRRCCKCVLPETYPFITFDEEGICNYCRKYKIQVPLGGDSLEAILEKFRSKDGSPDCIVGLSGGRDSSYGLHLLKTEFHMTPIAYTYDWALVTDLARRNQAKVIGKLGVEQIIRAADIHAKRRYIRKNIYAWLKKPELGMIPVFMTGDKMFYYYGDRLRNETGVSLTIFCAGQQLEQMEFKVGFCGIDQDLVNNTKLYHFGFLNKLRLAGWYSKQYIRNPSYINESLVDCILAFYFSFCIKDDYLYLYRYIPWNEELISCTLKEEYDWEADMRYGNNQWRMGDGQTAFTNYIYYTIAGFSEFDNFRSNQIREGLLTREQALKLLEEDNRPRMDMLNEFGQLIGFNLEEVLMRINRIPPLYNTN